MKTRGKIGRIIEQWVLDKGFEWLCARVFSPRTHFLTFIWSVADLSCGRCRMKHERPNKEVIQWVDEHEGSELEKWATNLTQNRGRVRPNRAAKRMPRGSFVCACGNDGLLSFTNRWQNHLFLFLPPNISHNIKSQDNGCRGPPFIRSHFIWINIFASDDVRFNWANQNKARIRARPFSFTEIVLSRGRRQTGPDPMSFRADIVIGCNYGVTSSLSRTPDTCERDAERSNKR